MAKGIGLLFFILEDGLESSVRGIRTAFYVWRFTSRRYTICVLHTHSFDEGEHDMSLRTATRVHVWQADVLYTSCLARDKRKPV